MTPIFLRLMCRDKFQQIRKMIHSTDPSAEQGSSLSKFLSALQTEFKNNYTPSQHVAVHEYLSLWKGRLKFKVYTPSKRERYGVKIYMLC